MKENPKRKYKVDLADIQDFIARMRRSREHADRERRASERAIRIMLREPPFEADMFPERQVRREGAK